MNNGLRRYGIWVVVALVGAICWGMLALSRGETINAGWMLFAALASYAIAFRFYARFIRDRVLGADDSRATPAERLNNGRDFEPMDRRVLWGHHFAAIAGAGPLVGPVLAAQMGFLPGTIWIIVGVILAGAVQDMTTLFFSMRRDGKSLGQMAREEIGPVGGAAALIAVLSIMVILLAVLALVVVNALAASPWGSFSLAMTIPIALLMGVYLRFLRPGRVLEVSIIGVGLLILAIIGGGWISESSPYAAAWTFTPNQLTLALVVYGFVASVLPVWVLLAPRDYLSTFMKIGTIALLAVGIAITLPPMQMPRFTEFAFNGQGPVFAGSLFPFVFIIIACGALSGFHSLVASGTTPKLIQKESQVRPIGYAAMLTESFVAVMAMIAAVTLDPGVYFAMNANPALLGDTVQSASQAVNGFGFSVSPETLQSTANAVGEDSIIGRTGGAPTLAVGISAIFASVTGVFGAALQPHTRPPHSRRVGLLPRAGGEGSTRGHQPALPALRHREPAPGGRRPDRRDDHPHKDGQAQVRLGYGVAPRMGRGGDAHGELAENLLHRPGHRLLRPEGSGPAINTGRQAERHHGRTGCRERR